MRSYVEAWQVAIGNNLYSYYRGRDLGVYGPYPQIPVRVSIERPSAAGQISIFNVFQPIQFRDRDYTTSQLYRSFVDVDQGLTLVDTGFTTDDISRILREVFPVVTGQRPRKN